MSPKREADDMMRDYNHTGNISNTKPECVSPASTKSESLSKPLGPNGRLRMGENEALASPLSSSRRGKGVKGIVAPSRRDEQLMRQVSGLDLDDFDRRGGGEAEDTEGGRIIVNGSALGGIIAPTNRQRQLMRQVSGLDMEDPVFGKNIFLDDSIKKEHASFFFDDMDINDIPEEMRDMVSLASDRTDVVDFDDIQSFDSKSFASAPLGLEPGAAEAQSKKPLRKGKKPQRKPTDQSIHSRASNDPVYVPPAAVYDRKKSCRRSNDAQRRRSNDSQRRQSLGSRASHDKALAVDEALAKQVDALLRPSGSNHSRSGFSNHSRTSFSNHNRTLKKGTRPKPRRQESRFSVASYVPPSLNSDGHSQRGERYMPESMDDIFALGKRVKKKRSSDDKKKKKKSPKNKPLKTKSLGSCSGITESSRRRPLKSKSTCSESAMSGASKGRPLKSKSTCSKDSDWAVLD